MRVEPFPDGQRAALAFSFDWESAMGGLIHSRSGEANAEGEGAAVSMGADGAPSVADAEEKGLRMRDGAQFLADLFARYGIRATFYATGYDLLSGNPTCEKFLGDLVKANPQMKPLLEQALTLARDRGSGAGMIECVGAVEFNCPGGQARARTGRAIDEREGEWEWPARF